MSTAATHAEPVAATLESVLAEHGPMLSRIAASHEADPTRRQDLLQEIGVALWRALPQWRAQASLRTYVARIAQNCAVDHVMRHAGRGFVALDDVHVDATADPVAQAEGTSAARGCSMRCAGCRSASARSSCSRLKASRNARPPMRWASRKTP
jgi:DNA-directed RNA polymerase specialized sigma24 family protein